MNAGAAKFVMMLALLPAACAAQQPPAGEPAAAAAANGILEITSVQASGPGSIRAAIESANSAGTPVRIVSRLEPGTEVLIARALPVLTAANARFDANGLLLASGDDCLRPTGRQGCDGLVIGGPGIIVDGLRATGFLFDGIAVRGRAAVGVRIENCHAYGNQDDGVGISAGATGVLVRKCVLENNGFRTKGKGILVFDDARAILQDNLVRGNRDGVTISRRAEATLIDNRIVENYDKGLGVAGATAGGSGNEISGNGRGRAGMAAPPNGDGLRVTLDSTVRLTRARITGNGDSGIVVIGSARLTLTDSTVRDNGGYGLHAAQTGGVLLRSVEFAGNGRGHTMMEDAASIVSESGAP